MNEANTSNAATNNEKIKRIEQVPTENLPTFYANTIQIALSLYDAILVFGTSTPSSENVALMNPRAQINMSPQLAKAIAILMRRKVEEYEKQFGPLPDVSSSLV